MAVIQHMVKLQLVMDYQELNGYVHEVKVSADVYTAKLREKYQQSIHTRSQVHIHDLLWSFQSVITQGRRYCLTQLRFGFNVALMIMKAIVETYHKRSR